MRRNRVVTIAAFVGVLVAAVTFLGAARTTGDEKNGKDSPKTITTVKSGSKGVVVFGNVDLDNGPGLLPLFPEMFPQPCKVIKVYVRDGKEVKKNDPLIDFDPELADLTVAEADAGLKQAQGAQKRADAAIKMADQAIQAHQVGIRVMAESVMSKSLDLESAKIDLNDKQKKADRVGAPNDPELLMAKKKYESAEKALEAEKIKLEGMKSITPVTKREEAEAALIEAKGAVAKQQAQLEKAKYGRRLMTLTAPEDGKIVRSFVADGLMIGAQTRQPAFLFQPKGKLIIRAEVDQEFASRLTLDQDASLQEEGSPGVKWAGKVIRLSDGYLPKRSNSSMPDAFMLNDARVLECIISIEHGNDPPPFRVGQRIKVSIGVE